jgi:hypothetical protein
MMIRTDFLDLLRRLSPALAKKDFVAIFQCFCFTGEEVYAYDDTLAIKAPCPTEFSGGVSGSMLLGFLAASRIKEIEILVEKEEITFKAGRSRMKAALVDPDEFLFEDPGEKGTTLEIGGDFISAVAAALPFMGTNPSQPDLLGLTLVIGKTSYIYASDNLTAVREAVEMKNLPKGAEKIILALSPRFCSLLVANHAKDPVKSLTLGKTWSRAEFSSGLTIYAPCVGEPSKEKYEEMFADILSGEAGEFIDIPKAFGRCCDRAIVGTGGSSEVLTLIRYQKKGRLSLVTQNPGGEIRDTLKLKAPWADLQASIPAETLARAAERSETFCIVPGAYIAFRSESRIQIAAVVNED